MSDERDETRLDEVQAYYDRLAPRLVAVEGRNWHLQSRMALNLETIDRYAPVIVSVDIETGAADFC